MRLTAESVDRASAAVKRPQYARTAVTPGIVHLGIGAFHRAHQAVVIDDEPSLFSSEEARFP